MGAGLSREPQIRLSERRKLRSRNGQRERIYHPKGVGKVWYSAANPLLEVIRGRILSRPPFRVDCERCCRRGGSDKAPRSVWLSPKRAGNSPAKGDSLWRKISMTARSGFQLLSAVLILLAACHSANAQCYQFSSGTAASLMVAIKTLPAPVIGSDPYGDTTYDYDLTGLSGNRATLAVQGTTATATDFLAPAADPVVQGGFTIHIVSGPSMTLLFMSIGSAGQAGGLSAGVQLVAHNVSLLATGFPATLPPLSAWTSGAVITASINSLTPASPPMINLPSFYGNLDNIGSVCACQPGTSAVVLNTVFAPQQQGNWCWAAVTQMMAVNVTGVETPSSSQCYIVNQVLNPGGDLADPHSAFCCLNESACNVTGALSDSFRVLGFLYSYGGIPDIFGLFGLSQQHIMQEIACKNHLIAFSIALPSSSPLSPPLTEHDLVIYGYQVVSGTLNIWVFDPQKSVRGTYQFQVSYADLVSGILPGYKFGTYFDDLRPVVEHHPVRPR